MSDYSYYLDWDASTDAESGIKEYIVYRNDVEIGRTTLLSFYVSNNMPDGHCYTVEAVDNSGNRSGKPICISYITEYNLAWTFNNTSSSINASMTITVDGTQVLSRSINGIGTLSGTIQVEAGLAVTSVISGVGGFVNCELAAYQGGTLLDSGFGISTTSINFTSPDGDFTIEGTTS